MKEGPGSAPPASMHQVYRRLTVVRTSVDYEESNPEPSHTSWIPSLSTLLSMQLKKKRMRPWKSLVVYLATGLFLLTFTGHLYSPGAHDPYAGDDLVMTGQDFIEKINMTNPIHKNFYIASPLYKHRLKPSVHLDHKVNSYHPVTYFVAAEIARRYSARYIIDLGCGSASKLSKLAGEFNVIGIDSGYNYQKARDTYPHLKIMSADLDKTKGCYVPLPPDILYQSVVISADVIEHLTDPFSCYLKLLQYMTRYAMAAVISSPDRERMAAVIKKRQAIRGPPLNARHVREWTVYEMDKLLNENQFTVLFSGWTCFTYDGCGNGFLPRDNPMYQQITALGNMNIRQSWAKGKLSSTNLGIKITAFLIMYPGTNQTLAETNIQSMLAQRFHVVLIRVNNTILLDIPIAGRVVVDQYNNVKTAEDLTKIIKNLYSRPYYSQGDWFFIQDAHESILTHHVPLWNLTLRNALLQVAQEPYAFNALAYSYFFIDPPDGSKKWDHMPFRVFGLSPWDEGNKPMVGPILDTLDQRVRAWRRITGKIELKTMVTDRGDTIVTDVNFMGRKVYPFHLLSLRMSPSRPGPKIRLEDKTLRMYILDAMLGFMTSARKAIMTPTFLY